MTNMKMLTAAMALGVATTCIAPPASARADSSFDANLQAIAPELAARSGQRLAAIRACDKAAASFRQYTWGDEELDHYRACMAKHGQTE